MRKLAGVVAMTVMLLLAACGGGQKPVSKTYTSVNNGQTITMPANVTNLVLLTGQGGTGSPEEESYFQYYSKQTTTYNQRNDLGGQIVELDGGTTHHFGPTPADYCDPVGYYYFNGVQNATQTCYHFEDLSYWETYPATTGGTTKMTGPNSFSRSWLGGTGGPAASQTAENVTVVAGGQYVLTIPTGGSITISYYE